MRHTWPPILLATLLWAQPPQSKLETSEFFNPMGQPLPPRRTLYEKRSDTVWIVEQTRDLNGRWVPLLETRERLLVDSPARKVIERWVQRFDQNGRPGQIEKILVEESQQERGPRRIHQQIYRGDLNGRLQLAERSTELVEERDQLTFRQRVIERPGPNGQLRIEERQELTEKRSGGIIHRELAVYRRTPSSGFFLARRELSQTMEQSDHQREVVDEFDATASGKLEFSRRLEREIRVDADGSVEIRERFYRPAPPARAVDAGRSRPTLEAEETTVRRPTPQGGYTETRWVRRVSLADPARWEPPILLSRTTCEGDCKSEAWTFAQPALRLGQGRAAGLSREQNTSANPTQILPAGSSQSTSPRR